MNQDDRRVRKTKQALKEALERLMLHQELSAITINELVQEADIHRATFYTHYQDIYDLYTQIEDEVIDALNAILTTDAVASYPDIYEALIEYTYDNANLVRILLGKNSNRNFQERLAEIMEQSYVDIWKAEERKNQVTREMYFLAKYHIQGCLAIVSFWIHNMQLYSKEEVTAMMKRVDKNFEQITV